MLPHLSLLEQDAHLDFELNVPAKKSPAIKKQTNISAGQKPVEIANPIDYLSPLDLFYDSWILKNASDIEKGRPFWSIKLAGPSVHIGKWQELTTVANKLPIWKFVIHKYEEQKAFTGKGHWYFRGEKPVYSWKEKIWLFQSISPHLYYESDEKEVYTRFYMDRETLKICKNSDYAADKKEIILHSSEAKINTAKFSQALKEFSAKYFIREFSLESGQVSVNLMHDGVNSQNKVACRLEDLYEKELILQAPMNFAKLNSKVKANVSLEYDRRKAQVSCAGEITEIEKIEKGFDTLTVQIERMDKGEYQEFIHLYQLRQANIDDFISRARGY